MSPDQRMMKILTADHATLARVDAVLEGKTVEKPNDPGDRRLLTQTQAAEILGCSRMTIFRMIRDGRLDAVEIRNGRLRISSAALTNFVKGGAV
jgi:excisionase family DNA binding protein